jgi:hypothetical protein
LPEGEVRNLKRPHIKSEVKIKPSGATKEVVFDFAHMKSEVKIKPSGATKEAGFDFAGQPMPNPRLHKPFWNGRRLLRIFRSVSTFGKNPRIRTPETPASFALNDAGLALRRGLPAILLAGLAPIVCKSF